MNVLFITYDFPYPTNSGGKARAYNLLKYASEGNTIHLVSFTRSDISQASINAIKEIGIASIQTFPRRKVRDLRNLMTFISGGSLFKQLYHDKQVLKCIQQVIKDNAIDVLHCESFYTAYFLFDFVHDSNIKKIYGSENLEFALYKKYTEEKAPKLLKPLYALQANRIKNEEDAMVKAADVTLAVTETEADYFRKLSNKVEIIENGVSLSDFAFKNRSEHKRKTILFVGNFDYFPNKDAVLFFYEKVFTKLKHPDLRFLIIGKGSTQFASLQDKRIETIEFIDDIKDAYYESDIFICPIRIGGGTNFKILEAMATGLPVVAFSGRVKEIGAVDERDVLLADDEITFLHQVEKLLDDTKLGQKLAKNARLIIEKKFSWDIIGHHLRTIWKT